LIQRILAGGNGMGGFYSPVGVGTIMEKNKEKKIIDGREYLLEMPLRATFSFVRAHKADAIGNLMYHGGGRASNPIMAMASDMTIAEVDHIVEIGEINPDDVVTPGIFVDRVGKISPVGRGSEVARKRRISEMFEGEK
jgi:acetate CoA/acetoacetate CoA-transferase alpha subunit